MLPGLFSHKSLLKISGICPKSVIKRIKISLNILYVIFSGLNKKDAERNICMEATTRLYKSFKRWISGDCPLWFTYWITGALPQGLLALSIYIIIGQAYNNAELLLIIVIVTAIYIPLSLIAITLSAIKYNGLWVWKALACLAVLRGCLEYVKSILMILQDLV